MVRDGQALRIADVTLEDDYLATDPTTRSELAVPVSQAGKIVGVVNAESDLLDAFGDKDERLLTTVAGQIGLAIEKLELFGEMGESLTRERQLNRLSRVVSSALELPEVLGQTVKLTANAVNADAGALSLMDKKGVLIADYYHNSPANLSGTQEPGSGMASRILRSTVSVNIVEYGREPEALQPWVEIGASAFLGVPVMAGDECLGVLGFFNLNSDRTFSERDQALAENVGRQAGIAIQNASLFQQVQTRAKELALALARQEELDRLKNEFIQNVSHELRTPLAIIRGYAEFLHDDLEQGLPDDFRKPLDTIARRSVMMTNMVEDLTAILEAEQRELKWEPVDLTEIVFSTARDFESAAIDAGIRLSISSEKALPRLVADANHLRRMVDNLISNAL